MSLIAEVCNHRHLEALANAENRTKSLHFDFAGVQARGLAIESNDWEIQVFPDGVDFARVYRVKVIQTKTIPVETMDWIRVRAFLDGVLLQSHESGPSGIPRTASHFCTNPKWKSVQEIVHIARFELFFGHLKVGLL